MGRAGENGGIGEAHVMMCIAGDFNGHMGRVETGKKSRSGDSDGYKEPGQELVELVMRNELAVAETFFKKRENHKKSP